MRNKGRGNRREFEKREKPNYLKKFFFWFISYLILISLFTLILKDTKVYEAKIGFYLIMGFILVIASRVIYSAWHRRNFRLSGIIIWGVIYSIIFGVLDYVLSLFPQISVNPSYDMYLNLALFSIFFTILLMFVRRMKMDRKKQGRRLPVFQRAPSQIVSGIILFVAGLLVFRFSYQIFVGWFNWTEGVAWSWLIGLILIIAGLLTIVAWWRNNVLQYRIGLKIGKWN